MDKAGIDVLIATSKHNVQYLLGGHRACSSTTWMRWGCPGICWRLIYPRGAPGEATYVGHRLETFQRAVDPLWVARVETSSSGSVDAIEKAAAALRAIMARPRRIGVEMAFLPMDAGTALARAFPRRTCRCDSCVLERLRAVKSDG